MPRHLSSLSISFAAFLLVLFPQFNAGSNTSGKQTKEIPQLFSNLVNKSVAFEQAVNKIYDSLRLKRAGLKKEVFAHAYKGYLHLLEKRKIYKEGIITICDFSQSSRRRRLYLIDINNYKLLLNTHVAHGRNSGREYASKFSNRPESLQSSLGFYVTKKTYWGDHGLSLVISGLEKGFNDKAEKRKIVLHGSRYIGDNYRRFGKFMGRSFGCPAVPKKYSSTLINKIKNGSCLFIYHPNKKYLNGSTILNG